MFTNPFRAKDAGHAAYRKAKAGGKSHGQAKAAGEKARVKTQKKLDGWVKKNVGLN